MLDTWNIFYETWNNDTRHVTWLNFVEQKCIERFANGDKTCVVEDKDS